MQAATNKTTTTKKLSTTVSSSATSTRTPQHKQTTNATTLKATTTTIKTPASSATAANKSKAATTTTTTTNDSIGEIEEISKKITEHADALYRTWRSRGLAPTELLEVYTKSTTEPSVFFGTSGSGGINNTNPDEAEAMAVAAVAAAAAGSTEGLQKLVNTFVIKDKEQRGVKVGTKTATAASTTATKAGATKKATAAKGEEQTRTQTQLKKPAAQKIRAKSPTTNTTPTTTTTTTKTGAGTNNTKILAKTNTTTTTTASSSSIKNDVNVIKKSDSLASPKKVAAALATTPTSTSSPVASSSSSSTALAAEKTADANRNYFIDLDIDVNFDVNKLSKQQAQNLLRINELLLQQQQQHQESNLPITTKTTTTATKISTKQKTKNTQAATATNANVKAFTVASNKTEVGKTPSLTATETTTLTPTSTSTTTTATATATKVHDKFGDFNKKVLKSNGNSNGIDFVDAVITRTDAIISSSSGSGSGDGGIAHRATTTDKKTITNCDLTANVNKRANTTTTTATQLQQQPQQKSVIKNQNKSIKSATIKETNDSTKPAVTKEKPSLTRSDKNNNNNNSNNNCSEVLVVAVSGNTKNTNSVASTTTTNTKPLLHEQGMEIVNNTTTATGNKNSTTTTTAAAATAMPTLNKVKPMSGRGAATLTNGQDKNLGRPILTRGSVAERVLMFEKCPDVHNSFLNIKRPDPADAPPKSLLKVKLHATPPPPQEQNSLQKEIRSTKSVYIPRFYFPHGKPQPTIAMERTTRGILSAFDSFPNNQVTKDELPRILKLCGLPFYWRMPVMVFCQSVNTGLVERQRFVEFWKQMNVYCHDAASRFVYILSRGQRFRSYISPEDLVPMVQDVVDTHPGLAFLKEATEFHSRYVHTVIARIFYSVNRSWSGKITIAELKRSDLLEIITLLEEEEDINQIMAFFSYEHFYVIYCKFWELDKDHDLLINQEDLARHSDHALSTRIVERIFSGCVTRSDNKKSADDEPKMSYTDFVWFILSEEDKRTPTAIEYWFRCMDIDGDGALSMYELEYFYEEQQQRMEGIGIECLPFEDCLCQMLDMIKPARRDCITLSDLKRCKMTHVFFDTFFNLEKYLDHEQRDPFASQRDEYSSDWDRFAAQEYELLITEEND